MRGFANLFNFRGRDTRAQFWPYAGIVVCLMMAAMMVVMMPPILSSMERMQRFANEHPDLAQVTQAGAGYAIRVEGYHPELMPDFGHLLWGIALVTAMGVALLAAAVARRLRDAGVAPMLGVLPVPFLFLGIGAMSRVFAATDSAMGWFMLLFVNNLLYLGSLVVLIVLLCRPSRTSASMER